MNKKSCFFSKGKAILLLALQLCGLPTLSYGEGATQMWWGFFKGNEPLTTTGAYEAATYDQCIFLSSSYAGTTISGIRFYIATTDGLQNVSVWAATSLPDSVSKADLSYQDVNMETIKTKEEGMTEVLLNRPFTVPAQGAYIGYSFKEAEANTMEQMCPLVLANVTTPAGGQINRISDEGGVGQWIDYYEEGGGYAQGLLTIQALVSGGAFKENCVKLAKPEVSPTIKGNEYTIPLNITNYGTAAVNGIDYYITEDGIPSASSHVDLEYPFFGYEKDTVINVVLQAKDEPGVNTCEITIARVNGKMNEAEAADKTKAFELTTVDHHVKRVSLAEGFTGTWDGSAPYVYATMEKLKRQHADSVANVVYHVAGYGSAGDEPMRNDAFAFWEEELPNSSTIRLNRGNYITAYAGTTGSVESYGFDKDYTTAESREAVASISAEAKWNRDTTKVDCEAKVLFNLNNNKATYAFGLVVVADSVAEPSWTQASYVGYDLGEEPSDNDLLPYASEDEVTNLTFRDVAVAEKGCHTGIANSIPTSVSVGQEVALNDSIDLTGNSLLAFCKEKSHLVAFIINTATGIIENAVVVPIKMQEATGVGNVVNNRKPAAFYLINGCRTTGMTRGLNVIKLANGKTVKVFRNR